MLRLCKNFPFILRKTVGINYYQLITNSHKIRDYHQVTSTYGVMTNVTAMYHAHARTHTRARTHTHAHTRNLPKCSQMFKLRNFVCHPSLFFLDTTFCQCTRNTLTTKRVSWTCFPGPYIHVGDNGSLRASFNWS